MKLLVIDVDYLANRLGEPVIRIYGKKALCSDEGIDVILHVKKFEPYFYADIEHYAKDEVEKALKEYIKRVECVFKYKPIGYQKEKSEMLKVVLQNPKSTPECRKILEEMDILCMEADILFKNRYLIDTGITGMGVIEFDHIGKELKNYGLNCNELYIIDTKEVKLTNDKINIEY